MLSIDDPILRSPRPSDLSLVAGRKRQSPRTGYVHFFRGDEAAADTIPLYENFCFALSLFEQKKTDCALEAKDLLARLFAFQTPEGNFPIYLHDFPRCYDGCQGLKIGPVLLRILKEFGLILSEEEKLKIRTSLEKILLFAKQRPLDPMWDLRLKALSHALSGEPLTPPSIDLSHRSLADLWEWAVSLQWSEPLSIPFFHPGLHRFTGPSYGEASEGREPARSLLDWKMAPENNLENSSLPLFLPALKHLFLAEKIPPSTWDVKEEEKSSLWVWKEGTIPPEMTYLLRMLWKGSGSIHSLVVPPASFEWSAAIEANRVEMLVTLSSLPEMGREDLFEFSLFVDASPDISLAVDGKGGSLFYLNDLVSIQSETGQIALRFELVEGEANFCGHLLRSNRPRQLSLSGPLKYEAYDWKIALRTLRRSTPCKLRVAMEVL